MHRTLSENLLQKTAKLIAVCNNSNAITNVGEGQRVNLIHHHI